MVKYVIKRIFYMFFVFIIMSLLLFFLYNNIPGDRAAQQVEPQRQNLEPEAFQKLYEQTREEMGLDEPIVLRYFKWFKGIIRFDLGQSFRQNRPVMDVVKPALKVTVFINVFSIFLSLAITIPLGIRMAVKKDSFFDRAVQVISIIGYSIPVFISALFFIYIFAVKLRWFPVGNLNSPNFQGEGFEWFKDRAWHLVLPLSIMVFTSLAGLTRYVRAAMVDALSMDYIKTARSKGLKEKVVIYSHAWRNALLPVITLIIGWMMSIFTGSFVLESTFNISGMGYMYIISLNAKDFNVVLGVQMFYILIALFGNLLIDLSYGIVDPRVRIDG